MRGHWKRSAPVKARLHILPAGTDFDNAWTVKFRDLFSRIEEALPEGGTWCSLEKAHTLAALVIGLRPAVVVELGVWMGGSLVPIAMAVQALGAGKVIAIDPWKAEASVAGQLEANAQWWGVQDHDDVYRRFIGRIERHQLGAFVDVYRSTSIDAPKPPRIDILHIDGNHGEQALADVKRFAPSVPVGGIVVLDDIEWEGDHVKMGGQWLLEHGFVTLYDINANDTVHARCRVYQRSAP